MKNIDDVNTLSTYWSEQFATGASDAIVAQDLTDAQVVFQLNVGQFIRGIANQF